MMHFGEHLMIDGYGGAAERLNDRDLVARFLTALPDELGMKRLIEPTVKWCDGNDIKDPGGWSGFVMIAESHISIHTFPGKEFLSADVYTCQNGMDCDKIERMFTSAFALNEIERNFVRRGLRYGPYHDVRPNDRIAANGRAEG